MVQIPLLITKVYKCLNYQKFALWLYDFILCKYICCNVTTMMRHDKQLSKHFTLDRIFMHSAYLWTRWLDAKAATKYCFVNGDNLSHALLAKQSGTCHNVERSYLAMTPLGMVRRGRHRVIEGNERLLLITPCLLSGVHTCFRNILPAVYNQATLCTEKRTLSRVSRLGSTHTHARLQDRKFRQSRMQRHLLVSGNVRTLSLIRRSIALQAVVHRLRRWRR